MKNVGTMSENVGTMLKNVELKDPSECEIKVVYNIIIIMWKTRKLFNQKNFTLRTKD